MDNNWIVENLTNAFGVWNSKMTEMWSLLTESPQTFKGGTIWQTIVTINGGMQAIGYGLLVLFFAIGIFRSASGFRDFQRPEHLLRHFIYFVLAKLGITYGMDLLVDVFDVCNGIVATAAGSSTTGTYRPYGLDCSGFVDWVFYNQSGSSYVIGHGGGATMQHSYCTDISWADAQPGDLVFYPDNSHVGIVGGRDANGELLIIHCASGYNNVVITGKEGFTSVGRPQYYGE